MSENKHTPGPWSLCQHLRDGDQCSCGYRGVIYGPEPSGIAICQPGHEPAPAGQEGTEPQRYPREVEIANAHLIAAAPDLLEAAKNAVASLEIEFGRLAAEVNFPMLYSAIDKAEGRS